jgi:hypothetical protein
MVVSKSMLSKLLKRELVDICSGQNISIPKTVKTKNNYIEFMIKFKEWNPPLDELLGKENLKKPTRTTSSSEISSLKQQIQQLSKQVSEIKSQKSTSSVNMYLENIFLHLIELETHILEAIPLEEFAFLDDIFDFLEGVTKKIFTRSIRKLVLSGILEFEEGEGAITAELIDGTQIVSVKRRF